MLAFSPTDCTPAAVLCKPLCGIAGASFRQLLFALLLITSCEAEAASGTVLFACLSTS
jgi:hypothetical protein